MGQKDVIWEGLNQSLLDFDAGLEGARIKECGQPLEGGKGKITDSPSEPP